MRTILEVDIIALKGATEASYLQGGGVTSFPAFTRVQVPALSKYASVTRAWIDGEEKLEHGDKVIPVDIAIEADRRAKHPWIIGEAARQLGYRLEPLETVSRDGLRISERDAHVILSEAMDVSRVLLAELQNGRSPDAFGRKQLDKELRELIAASQRILEKLGEE